MIAIARTTSPSPAATMSRRFMRHLIHAGADGIEKPRPRGRGLLSFCRASAGVPLCRVRTLPVVIGCSAPSGAKAKALAPLLTVFGLTARLAGVEPTGPL